MEVGHMQFWAVALICYLERVICVELRGSCRFDPGLLRQ